MSHDGTPQDELTLAFDADQPIGWRTRFHKNALLVPWGTEKPGGAFRAAGIFDNKGVLLEDGHCWRYTHHPITVEPKLPEDFDRGAAERLEGRWMFGGLFYGHFGHFLVETTTRLWALDKLKDLDGIVFYPKQEKAHERRQFRYMLPFFEACGLSHLQIRCPQKPVTIDAVAMPPPGFGMADMMEGRPEYRDWVHKNLASEIAPEGPRDIYVSRAHLPSKRGAVLMEDRIERLMEQAGYAVIHPQEMPLEQQLAQWKAARSIVSLDASALHLAAMLVSPETKVAIINRGPSNNIEDYLRQFRKFAGVDPLRIEAVTGFYHATGRRLVKRETQALLDFEAVGAALLEGGFIPSDAGWSTPSDDTLADAVSAAEKTLGESLQRYSL